MNKDSSVIKSHANLGRQCFEWLSLKLSVKISFLTNFGILNIQIFIFLNFLFNGFLKFEAKIQQNLKKNIKPFKRDIITTQPPIHLITVADFYSLFLSLMSWDYFPSQSKLIKITKFVKCNQFHKINCLISWLTGFCVFLIKWFFALHWHSRFYDSFNNRG